MDTLKYSSNNSGGSWWLDDKDWKAMEEVGWNVEWFKHSTSTLFKANSNGRWLGALADSASIPVKSIDHAKEVIRDWEAITGQNAADEGCNCCGRPHSFTVYDANGTYISDPVEVVQTTPSWH